MLEGQLGFKGERGDSAYEIAVKHGYTGTEEQWSDDFLNAENYYDKTESESTFVQIENIVDALDSTDTTKPLSANQGKALKTMVDTLDTKIDNIVDEYSTSEIKTNKVWIDGSPIYRKVVNTGDLSDTSRWTDDALIVNHNISAKQIIRFEAYGNDTYSTLIYPINNYTWWDTTLAKEVSIECVINDFAVVYTMISNYYPTMIKNSYVVIEYIKYE